MEADFLLDVATEDEMETGESDVIRRTRSVGHQHEVLYTVGRREAVPDCEMVFL